MSSGRSTVHGVSKSDLLTIAEVTRPVWVGQVGVVGKGSPTRQSAPLTGNQGAPALVLQRWWALLDAAEHRCQPVQVRAGLDLSFVPPGGAGVGQWSDQVACLGRVGQT